jgi:glycosyltransferase involved in cell wall biosynthesis
MKEWPITVIPTAIDLNRWKPMDKAKLRYSLGLPLDTPLILYGAMGGKADPRKGADLLFEALGKLKSKVEGTPLANIEIVVFGQGRPSKDEQMLFPVHYTGHLNDDLSLSMYYAVADIMIVPSRQDNLPGTALESQACGTPVAAFNIGGLPDIVDHQKNGWLANPFDTEDLARGIQWILEDKERHQILARESMRSAEIKYNPKKIASKYADLYHKIMNKNKR